MRRCRACRRRLGPTGPLEFRTTGGPRFLTALQLAAAATHCRFGSRPLHASPLRTSPLRTSPLHAPPRTCRIRTRRLCARRLCSRRSCDANWATPRSAGWLT